MARSKSHDTQLETLFEFGLGYPGAHVKSPWPGHRDLAVKDKTFAYLNVPGDPLSISCKLPHSCDEALRLPFTTPTAYGLGKSGWVSASFALGDEVPVDLLKAWIDESYRAQAPKKLSAGLPAFDSGAVLHPELEAVSTAEPPRRTAEPPRRTAKRPSTRNAPAKGATRKAVARKTVARKPAARKKAAPSRKR